MIQIENLEFTYPKNTLKTIKGISFSIQKGEIFGFLGPSGAGKSTTQKIIIGILKNYKGKVSVMGKEVSIWKSGYYEKIGIAFEYPNLYTKFTALENLRFFSSLYSGEKENLNDLLDMVGLKNAANTRVSDFSKGMKVRLNFIRAFVHKPEVLFLDEPTAGLDPVNAKIIKNIILKKKEKGKTVFVTTHNMTVADELCDRVAFLVDGNINLIDSPRTLKLEKGRKTVRVEFRENGKTVIQDFELDTIGTDEKFLTLIKTRKIETIHSQEASLEDVFIQTTGRRLV